MSAGLGRVPVPVSDLRQALRLGEARLAFGELAYLLLQPAVDLGDFLWSLLVIFFMITFFVIFFRVVVDLLRRKDASGWKKAIWIIVIFG